MPEKRPPCCCGATRTLPPPPQALTFAPLTYIRISVPSLAIVLTIGIVTKIGCVSKVATGTPCQGSRSSWCTEAHPMSAKHSAADIAVVFKNDRKTSPQKAAHRQIYPTKLGESGRYWTGV